MHSELSVERYESPFRPIEKIQMRSAAAKSPAKTTRKKKYWE